MSGDLVLMIGYVDCDVRGQSNSAQVIVDFFGRDIVGKLIAAKSIAMSQRKPLESLKSPVKNPFRKRKDS